ncbi:hypothetical protein Tco_1391815 [Tanacetum coccineum]
MSSVVRTNSTAIPSGITSIRIDSTSGPSVAETCMANIVNLGPASPSKNEVDEPSPEGVQTAKFASIKGMNEVLENGPWFIRSAPIILKKRTPNANLLKKDMKLVPIWSWGCMDYARTLIDIRADRELKEDMIIVILNVKDDGEVLHTNFEVLRQVTSSANPVDALKTIQKGEELGSNGGSTNSGEIVFQDVASLASGSPSNIPLVERINDLESQMIEGKLVLLDDEGKPLKPSKSTLLISSNVVSKNVDDLFNEDDDSEVEEVYDETATYMASTSFNVNKTSKSGSGGGNKSFYEQWKESHGEDP